MRSMRISKIDALDRHWKPKTAKIATLPPGLVSGVRFEEPVDGLKRLEFSVSWTRNTLPLGPKFALIYGFAKRAMTTERGRNTPVRVTLDDKWVVPCALMAFAPMIEPNRITYRFDLVSVGAPVRTRKKRP